MSHSVEDIHFFELNKDPSEQSSWMKGVVKVNYQVQRLHADAYPNIFKHPLDEHDAVSYFCSILKKETNFLWVGIMEDQVVGYIWFAQTKKKETPFKVAQELIYIHQIAVDEQCQSKGIGRGLLQKAADKAIELNINEIQLSSWSFNTHAHAFFERQGFVPYRYAMHKTLS